MNNALLFPYTQIHRQVDVPPFVIESARDIYVYDTAGNEYIDAISNLYNVLLGYSHYELISVATEQLNKLPFYGLFNNQTNTEAIKLANTLSSLSPIKNAKVFFASSGSEANDTAIKIAWYYNNALNRKAKKILLAFSGCYHGATIGSASLTGIEVIHQEFDLPIARVKHVPLPEAICNIDTCSEKSLSIEIDKVERIILSIGPDKIAGFVLEPIFTAPGVLIPSNNFLKKLAGVLKKHDILLIADEVVTSFMRCGELFYCNKLGITPDIITVSKGLTSSYIPISATIISDEIHSQLQNQSRKIGAFFHGFTYSGHPVAAAVANKAIQIYTDKFFVKTVSAISEYFGNHLRALETHEIIKRVRHVGMLGAIDVDEKIVSVEKIVACARQHGLLIRSCYNTFMIAPPLICTEVQLDEIFARLKRVVQEVSDH